MICIAVDAMGGDHAPGVIIDGAVAAARHLDVQVLLVGPTAVLEEAHQAILSDPAFVGPLAEGGYIVDGATAAEYREQLSTDFVNFGAILGN